MKFKLATYRTFKKDVSYRLAHKEQYKSVERTPDQQIDLLIVVDQMLTGFDSKWINTLYPVSYTHLAAFWQRGQPENL